MRLGNQQLDILRFMGDHRLGAWYEGCGWTWTTPMGTIRLLESLVRHGLVTKTLIRPPNSQPFDRYEITEAGRDAALTAQQRRIRELAQIQAARAS